MPKREIKLYDRVSEWGSWRCGTVVTDWGDSCMVDWDNPRKGDRKRSYEFKKRLEHTTYYNEFWGSVKAREDGVPMPIYPWKGDK